MARDGQRLGLVVTMSMMLLMLMYALLLCMGGRHHHLTLTRGRLRGTGGGLRRAGERLRRAGESLRRTCNYLGRDGGVGRICVNQFLHLYTVCISGVRAVHGHIIGLIGRHRLAGLVSVVRTSRRCVNRLCSCFSTTFLGLFPSFMRRFGTLLGPRRHVILRSSNGLSAAVHVFTLVHLNVRSDSGVTRFLRCSMGAVCGCHTGMGGKTVYRESRFRAGMGRVKVE